MLDLPVPGADPVIGDRAYGSEPGRVARLARAVCDGLLRGGVLPVIKHMPGHGRARVDSHHACPVVDAGHEELSRTDFAPFRALADMPWANDGAYRVHRARRARARDLVQRVIAQVIRGEIGFDGVLVSDDLSMQALGGSLGERTQQGARRRLRSRPALQRRARRDGGGRRGRRADFAVTAARLARGEARRRGDAVNGFDRGEAEARLEALLGGRAGLGAGGTVNPAGGMSAMIYQASTWVLPVIFAVTFHEAAHGFVASRLGDDTALRAGRVTFNPLKHVDPFGTIILPAMLMLLRSPFLFSN